MSWLTVFFPITTQLDYYKITTKTDVCHLGKTKSVFVLRNIQLQVSVQIIISTGDNLI